MPRELVHWEVLLQAQERAKAEGATKIPALILDNREVALLGAVAHDAPYYYRWGGDPFERVANGLHGLRDMDTFHPLRLLVSVITGEADERQREMLWALVLGMYSHAIVDQWFHPWVFYYTGDYYHQDLALRSEARRKHRLLEVYLEGWMAGKVGASVVRPSILSLVMALRGKKLNSISRFLGATLTRSLFFPEEEKVDTTAAWYGSFWYLGLFQYGLTSDTVGALFDLIAKTGLGKTRELESLSSYKRREVGSSLSGRFSYLNPATGEARSHTLDEMFSAAVDECARLFVALDGEIDSPTIPTVLRMVRGVSLNYGAWGIGPGEATHYAAEGLRLPGF